jgi:hypothetical protein
VETLRRVHSPGEDEAQRRECDGDDEHKRECSRQTEWRWIDDVAPADCFGKPAQEHEYYRLQHGDRGAAEHLAKHHRPTRNGGDEHALQESFAAILDDRDRGEDGCEEQDHH